jgi:hypothetical protein
MGRGGKRPEARLEKELRFQGCGVEQSDSYVSHWKTDRGTLVLLLAWVMSGESEDQRGKIWGHQRTRHTEREKGGPRWA